MILCEQTGHTEGGKGACDVKGDPRATPSPGVQVGGHQELYIAPHTLVHMCLLLKS